MLDELLQRQGQPADHEPLLICHQLLLTAHFRGYGQLLIAAMHSVLLLQELRVDVRNMHMDMLRQFHQAQVSIAA